MRKLLRPAGLVLLLIAFAIQSCNKDKKDTQQGTQLLSGSSSKAWQLNKLTTNGAEQCVSECSKKNDRLVFNSNGTYAVSTYSCDERPCGDYTSSQDGDTGQWSLEQNNKVLKIDGLSLNVVTLTENELVMEYNGGKLYYIKSTNTTLLNRLQQLTGTGTSGKRWKYKKRMVDGVEQPLSATLLATRFTNMANGVLITSYTDTSLGQTVTGNWAFNTEQTSYTSIRPAAGTLPALNITFTILELTETSFIVKYTDGGGHLVELYEIPE